jgi:uncharacterized protein YkwD
MFLHVAALGVALIGLLVGGVVAMESIGARSTKEVITDTFDAAVPPLAGPLPSGSPTPAPSAASLADASAAPPASSTAPGPPVGTPSTAPPPSPKDRITTMEDEVTELINKERAKAGCGSVRTDERMRVAGRAHSADMAKNNYFSHTGLDGSTFVDRLERAGYPRSGAAGENIAYGYATAQDVVTGWMNSEGHRNNILNCSAKATGVGLAYRGSTPYWTQLFGRI